jgi:hypothetical protein
MKRWWGIRHLRYGWHRSWYRRYGMLNAQAAAVLQAMWEGTW